MFNLLRQARQLNMLSLEQLSKRCGLSVASLSNFETGKSIPTIEAQIRIARALNVERKSIFTMGDLDYDKH